MEEDNKLIWKGVEYDNLDDYQKAIDDSGAGGKAGGSVMGEAATLAGSAATVLAPGLVGKAAKTWGVGKVLDVGMQAAFPDQEDTLLEQYAELLPKHGSKLKTGIKAGRLLKDKVNDIFDHKIYKNVGNAVKSGFEEIWETPGRIKNTVEEAFTGGVKVGAADNTGYINPIRQPDVPIEVRTALANAGIRDNGTFHFDTYLTNRKSINPKDRRALAGLFMTDPPTGFTGPNMEKALKNYTNLEKAKFMKIYTPEFLKKYDIDPTQLQLHHINALLGSLPLYDGVRYLSPEWMEITGTLLQKNVHAGNSLKNLRFLVGRSKDFRTPHGVTHKYLDEVVGPDGTLFFTKEIRENLRTLKGPYQAADGKTYKSYRSYISNNWADVVNKSNDITDQAVGIFNAVNADLLHLKPENIDEIMQSIGRLEADGLVKPSIIEGRFQLDPKDIKKVIFDMEFDLEIGQYMLNTPQKALNTLKEAISSNNPVSAYRAIRTELPQQLQLFSNTKIKKLKKKYKKNLSEYPSGPGAYWDIESE